MKMIFLSAAFMLLSLLVNAQDCQGFMAGTVNTTLEYNHLNAKGKIESSHKTIVKEIGTKNESVFYKTANFYYDNKGVETYKSEQEFYCKNGVLTFNMSNMFDPSVMSQYQTMEVSLQSDNMDIPYPLTVGQTLNNGSATMVISNQGIKMMTMTVNVTNRKVEAKETITVAGGTYECYKITYDVESKIMFKVQAKCTEWYSVNVGLIKSENYDKNGKLTGSTELKSFSK